MHHDILGGSSRFVTVVESKFSGVVERTLDGQTIPVTDSEKTLVDAADRLDLSGEIAQLARALQAAWSDLDLGRLEGYLQRWSTGSLLKRIGHLVECLERPFPHRDERLARWRRSLSSGIVALEPGHRTTAGRIVPHWRLRVNVEETWRGKLHPVMADRDRQKAGTTERRSRAASVAEEEELVAELGLLGIRYLSRQSSYQASQVRSPEQLLADLVRPGTAAARPRPHGRDRSAACASRVCGGCTGRAGSAYPAGSVDVAVSLHGGRIPPTGARRSSAPPRGPALAMATRPTVGPTGSARRGGAPREAETPGLRDAASNRGGGQLDRHLSGGRRDADTGLGKASCTETVTLATLRVFRRRARLPSRTIWPLPGS